MKTVTMELKQEKQDKVPVSAEKPKEEKAQLLVMFLWTKPKDDLMLLRSEKGEYRVASAEDVKGERHGKPFTVDPAWFATLAQPKGVEHILKTFVPTVSDLEKLLWEVGVVDGNPENVSLEAVVALFIERLRKS